jgi:hypothetical protein
MKTEKRDKMVENTSKTLITAATTYQQHRHKRSFYLKSFN